jgi:hypothetical protein
MSLIKFWWNGLLFALTLILFLIGHFWIPMFLAFASGTFSVSIIFLVYHFITACIIGEVNDNEEIIKKSNVAYAIYQVGIMFLIAIAYGFAFITFFTLK